MEEIKYSFGIGDRFGLQGKAQLEAFRLAEKEGITIVPVWNKSYREHSLVNTSPGDVRKEADEAVGSLGWKHSYHVDADHINLKTVDAFIDSSDFFTIDVADCIGQKPDSDIVSDFLSRNQNFQGELRIHGIGAPLNITHTFLEETAAKFSMAIAAAAEIYRHIADKKNGQPFVTEISMDEVASPQNPAELFFILGEIAHAGIPVNTIAPRFTGSFHKGVDYIGDIRQFRKEFEEDLMVIEHAVNTFGLPSCLRLSVHSGSDKFSIYPVIKELIRKHKKGLHLKTAGTTWLEEFAGMLVGSIDGLAFGKFLYSEALGRYDELLAPYLMVTDIDQNSLPTVEEIQSWPAEKFAGAVVHDQASKDFNPDLRQFIHLAYKIAAENFTDYKKLVINSGEVISQKVTDNIFRRHIKPLFID